MAVAPINLPANQRAERKLLITVAEWTEGSGSTPIREILGRRTEDSFPVRSCSVESFLLPGLRYQ